MLMRLLERLIDKCHGVCVEAPFTWSQYFLMAVGMHLLDLSIGLQQIV